MASDDPLATTTVFINMCGMFLVPATILFAAIGIAKTEELKALISVLGMGLSSVWLYRIYVWDGLSWPDRVTGLSLAGIFLLASTISASVHILHWMKGGKKSDQNTTGNFSSPSNG